MSALLTAAMEELAREQFGAYSHSQARAMGFTPDQIQYKVDNGLLVRKGRGLYVLPGWPETFEQRCMIAQLRAGSGAFLSHRCAAMLRCLDGVYSAPVEITVPRPLRRIPDVVVHYSSDATIYDWTMLGPLAVATVTRIIIDLAGTKTSVNTLERIYECGQRRGETGEALLDETASRLARRGKPGTVKTRSLLAQLVRDGKRNGSDAETLFFQILRDAGLPLPTRQKEMLREDGSHAYTDYAYEGVDAVLEVLGYEKHSSRTALTGDAERNNDLNLSKLTLLEFTWTHLTKDRDYIVRTVKRLLRDNNRH